MTKFSQQKGMCDHLAGQPGRDSMVGKSNTSGEEEEEVPARSKEESTTVGLARPNSKKMLLVVYNVIMNIMLCA